MKRGAVTILIVGLFGCGGQQTSESDRALRDLEAFPAKQQACFDALDSARMDLNVSGVAVRARTAQDIDTDITLSIMMKEQLRRSLEGYMTALQLRDRPRLMLYMEDVHKIIKDKMESNYQLVQIIHAAAKRALEACTDEICLKDMKTFNRLFWAKANRAYDCPD